MQEAHRLKRLPPYLFNIIDDLKNQVKLKGVDVIDFGMGNPDLIEGAADAMEPLRIPNYLKELCSTFHVFYTKHRVRVEDPALRSARLALIEATRIVIHNGLNLLGVNSPNKM